MLKKPDDLVPWGVPNNARRAVIGYKVFIKAVPKLKCVFRVNSEATI